MSAWGHLLVQSEIEVKKWAENQIVIETVWKQRDDSNLNVSYESL